MRRKIAASVAAVAVCAGLSAQSAFANQAGRYRGNGDDATRANITGSATNNSTGLVFASVTVQNAPPTGSPTAGLQIGEVKETAGYAIECGPPGSIGIVVERVIGGGYNCNLYFGVFGSNHRFAIVHGSNGWSGYEDGPAIDGPWALGMTSGYSVARAESYWSGAGPNYNFTWGPSGFTAWQYSTCGGCSYTTINSATPFNGGGWTVGAPPSPFSISR
jgi:hypothetical protein